MSETNKDIEKESKSNTSSGDKLQLDSTILASYKIISLLGQGDFGIVYKAEHKTTPGLVALKLIRKEIANSETALNRLGEDARAITALNHPNIVDVREFGTGSDGSAYLAMEFIDGSVLSERLAKGPLSRQEALDIAMKICNGLTYAHSKGILHRDLKPQNIILENPDASNPGVKLVDLGISKIRNEVREQNLTQTGDLVGSPYYISPEQGQGFQLDPRSDVYSVGCVLYEMLTHEVPLKGPNSMQTLLKHINETPVKPSERAPALGLANELDDVVMKCLEKDPANRYQTIDELKNDLRLICEGKAPNLGKAGNKTAAQTQSQSANNLVSKVLPIILVVSAILGALFLFLKPH